VLQGSYAGNAAGFKLNTLPKLLDTRANKPRMTFLHFVVQVAERNNRNALAFTKDLSDIHNICKYVSACSFCYFIVFFYVYQHFDKGHTDTSCDKRYTGTSFEGS
jgi:hypothetical protein